MAAGESVRGKMVVLIHGFSRNARDMRVWKSALENDFDRVVIPNLPMTHGSAESCMERLRNKIAAAHPEEYAEVYLVGHSMGGLLAREYLQREKPANVKKLLCVGTPHHGSLLADILLLIPGMGWIFKPLVYLSTFARKEITTPEIPGLQIGSIISSKCRFLPGRIFLRGGSDGVVALSSAHAPDADCEICVAVPHAGMMFSPAVSTLIRRFLQTGSF